MLTTSGRAFVFGKVNADGDFEVMLVSPQGNVSRVGIGTGGEYYCIRAVATVCDRTGAIYGGVEGE